MVLMLCEGGLRPSANFLIFEVHIVTTHDESAFSWLGVIN